MGDPLDTLQDTLGYRFTDQALLKKAMTHSSTGEDKNYERLEFLGDRVLGLVMAHILFETFPDEPEGALARRHSALVQGTTLSSIAGEHGLGDALILSQAERESGGAENENILADAMEALLAALYRDGGLKAAHTVIERWWGDRVHTMVRPPQDPKTALQEWVQARGFPLPTYDVVGRDGPDHAPLFTIEVCAADAKPVQAQGSSRRAAEKKAAKTMLKHLMTTA